jgi:hypothetical protein
MRTRRWPGGKKSIKERKKKKEPQIGHTPKKRRMKGEHKKKCSKATLDDILFFPQTFPSRAA